MKYFHLKNMFFIFLALLLTACNASASNLKDGDAHLTDEMNETISNYIVNKYADLYLHTEKQFEVHKVYGTSELDEVISVYMWSYYSGFNVSTALENQAGHSLPAFIQLKKVNSEYEVIKYTEPGNGSEYLTSLKKMFPDKYVKLALQDSGNISDLEKVMNRKVEQWLKEK